MIRSVIAAVLLAGLLGSAVALMPLATVLELAGAPASSFSWASAEGTLVSGKLRRLRRDGILIGDLDLSLRPGGFRHLALEYDLNWQGPAGAGSGRLAASPDGELAMRDFQVDLDLAKLDGLTVWMRQSGAHVRVEGALVRIARGACLEAAGQAWSDVLVRNETFLGTGWHELSGPLHCDQGALVIPVASAGPSGAHASATARLGMTSGAQIEAHLTGNLSEDLRYLAGLAGFTQDGTGLHFSHILHEGVSR